MPQNVYIYDPNVSVPKSVRHVQIPEGITVIKSGAFSNCSRLKSIIIPDSVTKIGNSAFWACSDLQSVTIPDSVTEIGNSAFRGCSGLQSVTIPDGVTEISKEAFAGCSGLKSLSIPESVTKIQENAFSGCSAIQSVIIPDSVTEIGTSVFNNCSDLHSVTISKNITKISYNAFRSCPELRSVVIPDGATEIGTGAFRGCINLQSVTIPDSVTKVGNYAFHYCSALLSVTIPDGVTEIGHSAFEGCSRLQSITIPDGVTKIKDFTLQNCAALQSVTLPDSVDYIGDNVFDGCSGLQSVTIPDGLTMIGENIFRRCSGLQSITIPDGVKEISDSAFNGCSGLRSITIPDGVTEISYNAFEGCSGLQSITIPDSVTKIGLSAFNGCSGLQSVVIPDGVTKIGYKTFFNCSALQSVTIPDSVTEIGEFAFYGCSTLQSVTIPDGITKIYNNAFARCPALRSFMYKGVNIAPFINIDGYGVKTFSVINALIEHQIPLSESTVKFGIDMAHRGELSRWIQEYPVFGIMRLSPAIKSADEETEEHLRQCFLTQKRTKGHVPEILNKLAVTACVCGIPPERLAGAFDIGYTRILLDKEIPLVPATACRCYYDRGVCDMLIRKGKVSVMAEAIGHYNKSEHQKCYKHLMDFILSHPDTRIDDLQYAVSHAEEIPMRAETTLTQVRQHRTYTENLAEVTRIEAKYGKIVPGFKLSGYPCSIDPVSITYDGMTARVLDPSNDKDIALAAGLGDLTNCCQSLGKTGETAMMHGFMNPDAGFWVIEGKDGTLKAQAEIWEADGKFLVFDNIEFANTDSEHTSDRAERLRGVIAAWAMQSGYQNIIMGCGYNELGVESMEQAPIPKLRLTPEEVYALQEDNDAGVYFADIGKTREYMQTGNYNPNDFVYTDANGQCVYIKKDGVVSDYLIKGYDRAVAKQCCPTGRKTSGDRNSGSLLM